MKNEDLKLDNLLNESKGNKKQDKESFNDSRKQIIGTRRTNKKGLKL